MAAEKALSSSFSSPAAWRSTPPALRAFSASPANSNVGEIIQQKRSVLQNSQIGSSQQAKAFEQKLRSSQAGKCLRESREFVTQFRIFLNSQNAELSQAVKVFFVKLDGVYKQSNSDAKVAILAFCLF